MSDELRERTRSHSYSPHPRIEDYLTDQRRRSLTAQDIDLVTVRERRPSGVSIAGSDHNDDPMDGHFRCITPARDDRKDLECVICFNMAINPFRCSKPAERAVQGIDHNQAYDQVYHLCCYQCLTRYMMSLNVEQIPCPYCQVNEFYLPNLKCANTRTITDSEAYVIDCPNGCGLMGSPVALANHICALQDPNQSGHTSVSITVSNLIEANWQLNQENAKMRAELAHVVVSYETKKRWVSYLEARCRQLSAMYGPQFAHMMGSLNAANHLIGQLTADIAQRDQLLAALEEQKKEIKRSYKANLNKVAKLLKTKIQELEANNERLRQEIYELVGMSSQQRTQNDASQTDSDNGDLELHQIFAERSSQTMEETHTDQ